jgi:winged helix DNA-binding protein
VDGDQILAFRLGRAGLAAREARSLAEAAACPASDFARDAALLALAARVTDVSREAYLAAVDAGDLVVAFAVRGAIHALAPGDDALFGRALIGRDEVELVAQIGGRYQVTGAEPRLGLVDALEEVTVAVRAALADGRALDKNTLHDALRARVRPDLLPWCEGCASHHVAPRLWRAGARKAGARLDSARRYTLGEPGPEPRASEAVRRFLGFYGPAVADDFAAWAGVTGSHARRLWDEVAGDLAEVPVGGRAAWVLREDVGALETPPAAAGVRLLPPGDPYLQKPSRPLLAPDPELHKRMFRPVGSPGAVLKDGRLVGLWRLRGKGKRAELTVEPLGRLVHGDLEDEARRVARLRGDAEAAIVLG